MGKKQAAERLCICWPESVQEHFPIGLWVRQDQGAICRQDQVKRGRRANSHRPALSGKSPQDTSHEAIFLWLHGGNDGRGFTIQNSNRAIGLIRKSNGADTGFTRLDDFLNIRVTLGSGLMLLIAGPGR